MPSEDLFLKYAEAVRYQDLFTLISDREQISSINKKKEIYTKYA
jgi:hypothetical protein